MIKALLNRKVFSSLALTAVICATVVTFMHVRVGEEIILEHAFMSARDGYIPVGEFKYGADVFFCSLNLIIALPTVMSSFAEDLDIAKSFIFIRLNDINKWFSYKYIQTFIYCLYYSFIHNLSIFLTVLLLGFRAQDITSAILYMLWGSFAGFLILFMLAVFGNTLSILIKPHIASGVTVGLTVILMTTACFLHHDQTQYHILTNYFISWHTFFSVNKDFYSLPTWAYYAIVSAFVSAELISAKKVIKKKDFI